MQECSYLGMNEFRQNRLSPGVLRKNVKKKKKDYNFACGSVWVCNLVSDT
jgi:hypothetical protein